MEFHAFDVAYIRKLTAAEPDIEAHFSAYFSKFIFLKLRSRKIAPELAEDVRQETLLRVLNALRHGSGVAQAERFGAFVNSVCNRVLLEFLHKQARHPPIDENGPEAPDTSIDLDAPLVNEQRRRIVADILDELSPKDREILRLVFFEEADRGEICDRLAVDAGYLRVLLHRAKLHFGEAYARKHEGIAYLIALLCCNGMATWLTIHMGANR